MNRWISVWMMDTLRKDLKSILIFRIESKEELEVLEFFFQLERSILRDDFDLLIQFSSSTIGN